MEMEAQEIQTLKPTYSRLNSSEEKWLSIPLYSNWLKWPNPVKKFRLDVGDGYQGVRGLRRGKEAKRAGERSGPKIRRPEQASRSLIT